MPTTSKHLLPGSTSASSWVQEPSEVTVGGLTHHRWNVVISSQLLLFLLPSPLRLSETLPCFSSDHQSRRHKPVPDSHGSDRRDCGRELWKDPDGSLWAELQCRFSVPIGPELRPHVVSAQQQGGRGGATWVGSQSDNLPQCAWAESEFSAAPQLVSVPPNYQTTKLLPAAAELPKHSRREQEMTQKRKCSDSKSGSDSIKNKILVWKWTFVSMFACKKVKQTNIFSSWRLWIPLEAKLRSPFLSGEKMEPLKGRSGGPLWHHAGLITRAVML